MIQLSLGVDAIIVPTDRGHIKSNEFANKIHADL